jgi:hypothetical protein
LERDCFDKLEKAKVLLKLYLRQGYYQVRIVEGDESKTSCLTRYASFEFLVMHFSFCNAPTTFFTLMNDVFRLFLNKSMVVYQDDIVGFSENLEDHKSHWVEVFKELRQNQLYLKKSKCVFRMTKIPFLGHWIGQGCIHMDLAQIRVIKDWEELRIIHEVRSFLGSDNYYYGFVKY